MAKMKFNLPKWLKIVLWVLGILVGIFVAALVGWKMWLSTWKTYSNDDFGFSFKYPSRWNIITPLPVTKSQINKDGMTFFYVDSKETLSNSPQDPLRSPGGVQVWIGSNGSMAESHQLLYGSSSRPIRYGKYVGNTFGYGVGGKCDPLVKNRCKLTSLSINTGFDIKTDYFYYVNFISYADNVDLVSHLKTRFYGLIGSTIISSFNFYK